MDFVWSRNKGRLYVHFDNHDNVEETLKVMHGSYQGKRKSWLRLVLVQALGELSYLYSRRALLPLEVSIM